MYIPSMNISWQTLDNETFIIDERSGKIYKLEEISNYIWKLILDRKNFEEICCNILLEYKVDKEEVERDIKMLIDNLIKLEFIEEIQSE